jgi:hypothetical protein
MVREQIRLCDGEHVAILNQLNREELNLHREMRACEKADAEIKELEASRAAVDIQ